MDALANRNDGRGHDKAMHSVDNSILQLTCSASLPVNSRKLLYHHIQCMYYPFPLPLSLMPSSLFKRQHYCEMGRLENKDQKASSKSSSCMPEQ